MSYKRLVFATVLLALSQGEASAAVLRGDIKATIEQACHESASACIAAVDALIGQYSTVKCSLDDRIVAQGLADAVLAISETQTDLAVDISALIVRKGSKCFQLAFGEVIDGVGTAATENPPSLLNIDPPAGSPG